MKNPIIFTSFLPPSILLKLPGTEILTTMGHGYLQLPYTDLELHEVAEQIGSLNDFQLRDVVRNFCEARGIFSGIFHAFKGQLRSITNNPEVDDHEKAIEIGELFFQTLSEIKKENPDNLGLHQAFIRSKNYLDEKKIQETSQKILELNENSFYSFLPVEDDVDEITNSDLKAWEVLILDDEPFSLIHLENELNRRGIKSKIVGTVQEAKSEITSDFTNKYCVVISDFRLLKPKEIQWPKARLQQEQGYDFLNWLSTQFRFNAMVALSGLGKQFLMESFRKHQLNIKVYSKNELDKSVKLFVDDVEYLGNQNFEIVTSQPDQKDWKKDTLPTYVIFRKQSGFDSLEQEISNRAKAAAIEIYNQAVIKEEALQLLSLTSEYGNAQQNILATDTEENAIKKLIQKLILRRVALYCFCRGIGETEIAQLMMYGNTLSAITDSNQKQVFSKLHLKLQSDIPYHILPEERNWLENNMGVPIFEVSQQLDVTIDIINQFLNLPLNRDLMESIKTNNQDKFAVFSIRDLEASLNKLMIKKFKLKESKHMLEELLSIADKLMELMPAMKHPGALRDTIISIIEKHDRNDNRP